MAKVNGLPSALYVGQYDLSGDTAFLNECETSRGVLSVTSIQDAAESRILGLKDGQLGWQGYFNITAGQNHPVLSALPTSDRVVSFFNGVTVGSAAFSMVGKQITYAPARAQDGSLLITTHALANGYGGEWSGGGTGDGMLTTGLQSFATGTVSGASIDLGSTSTLFGAAGYLHVTTMPSGTLTVTIEDSANDSSFTAVTGMTFTNLTGPGSERVQGAVNATVRRYVRVTCSGTHGTASVAVNFIRYLVSPAT